MPEHPSILYSRARELLLRHYGYPDFRPAQQPVVRSILEGRDVLAVLPTGAGKSICFQLPALALGGVTLVISPLVALMQDQVEGLRRRGIGAGAINSGVSAADRKLLWDQVAAGRVQLLYCSPEGAPAVAEALASRQQRVALLAVDEAHCIVEWGHDFRPAYRTLGDLRAMLGQPPTVGLTGSATPAVRADIQLQLRLKRPVVHVGSFDRPNLHFSVRPARDLHRRLDLLATLLQHRDGLTLVYAPTRALTEAVARVAADRGHVAMPYHAGLDQDSRRRILQRFLNGELEVLAATSAFGMGIDKPDVRLVVHWTMPPSPESYYQEAGRAGRDGNAARCILLHTPGDAELHRRQMEVTFPPERQLERIWQDSSARAGVPDNVLASADRLRAELAPGRAPVDWRRVRARRRSALERIEIMERYALDMRCRRAALVGYFGEELGSCSGCDWCDGGRKPESGVRRWINAVRQLHRRPRK
ncbi:MAG: ATP-dependent DNA helicase RecQ [Gemmatimonadota bacterium]